ncbi:MAG: hypothetical protein EOM14_04640 [Clostridia bacterium]|nr:hypothetical protein [Clostridia bacterium]
MEVELIYPVMSRQSKARERWRSAVEWTLAAAAYACPIINLCVGGKAWSLVVVWSLWCVWRGILNRPLVEDNRISRSVDGLIYVAVMLVLIELFLSSGWAVFVIPMVCFGMLLVIATFFFTDLPRQRQNIMPMLWVIAGTIVAVISALIIMPEINWPMLVMGFAALAMLIVSAVVMRWGLWLEIEKRFHTR